MKKIIITAGGTRERIDEVRSIRNSSSGKLGSRIADVCYNTGLFDQIYYLASSDAVRPECYDSDVVTHIETTDNESVFRALKELLTTETIDFVVHSMAVSDYSVSGIFSEDDNGSLVSVDNSSKVSSSEENLFIRLKQNPKIIDSIRLWQSNTFLVGFKLLDDVSDAELEEVSFRLLRRSRANLIVANDLHRIREGNHEALLVYPEKQTDLLHGKEEIATVLVQTMLRRAAAKHIKSVRRGDDVKVSDEIFEQMKDIGRRLDTEGLLPHVETGTYGNMSIRDKGDSFVITGRNVAKGNLTPDLLTRIVGFEKVEHDTLHSKTIDKSIYCRVFYEGSRKPSIDSGIHAHVYDEFDFDALVHVHTNRIFEDLYLTPDNPPCGSEPECRQTLDGFRSGTNVVQLYKHGLIAGAKSLEEGYNTISNTLKGFCLEPLDQIPEEDPWLEYQRHYREVYPSGLTSFEDKRNFWLVQENNQPLGIVYTRKNSNVLEFAIYSLEATQGKGLGIGRRALGITKEIAQRNRCNKLRLVTTEACGVVDYYLERGFEREAESNGIIHLSQYLK